MSCNLMLTWAFADVLTGGMKQKVGNPKKNFLKNSGIDF